MATHTTNGRVNHTHHNHDEEDIDVDDTTPIIVDEITTDDPDVQDVVYQTPRRSIVVEPFIILFVVSGMPMYALQIQYMYQKIARDLGVNITGNKS